MIKAVVNIDKGEGKIKGWNKEIAVRSSESNGNIRHELEAIFEEIRVVQRGVLGVLAGAAEAFVRRQGVGCGVARRARERAGFISRRWGVPDLHRGRVPSHPGACDVLGSCHAQY